MNTIFELAILGTDTLFPSTPNKNNISLVSRIHFIKSSVKGSDGRPVESSNMKLLNSDGVVSSFFLTKEDTAEIRNVMANNTYYKLLEHLSFPDKFIIRVDRHSSIKNDRYIMEAVDFVFLLEKFMDSMFMDNGGDIEQLIGEEVIVPFF